MKESIILVCFLAVTCSALPVQREQEDVQNVINELGLDESMVKDHEDLTHLRFEHDKVAIKTPWIMDPDSSYIEDRPEPNHESNLEADLEWGFVGDAAKNSRQSGEQRRLGGRQSGEQRRLGGNKEG